MSEVEADGFAGIDPLLTIHQGTCYLEAVDKRGKRSLLLSLDPTLWEEGFEFEDGTTNINITPDFIQGLTGISARFPLDIEIGAHIGDEQNKSQWCGEITKTFAI